jgi:predicted nucleic acid-binding Zn ribbon protein
MTNDPSSKKKDPNKKDPKNKAHLTAAADVLQALLQNSKSQLSEGFLRWRLEQQWRDIVGPTIAEQTVPAALEKKVLHIWVRHSAWMQQLWYFRDVIKEKVNTHIGQQAVNQVHFTLSRRAATKLPEDSQD